MLKWRNPRPMAGEMHVDMVSGLRSATDVFKSSDYMVVRRLHFVGTWVSICIACYKYLGMNRTMPLLQMSFDGSDVSCAFGLLVPVLPPLNFDDGSEAGEVTSLLARPRGRSGLAFNTWS